MSPFYTKTLKKIAALFSNKSSDSEEEFKTSKLGTIESQEGEPTIFGSEDLNQQGRISPKQLIVGVARDVGRQRNNNEDSLFSLSTVIDSNDTSTAFGIFIIADGMGGHNNGEIASELAVRSLSYHLVKSIYPAIFSLEPSAPSKALQEIMLEGFFQANEIINNKSNGGGTTLTAVLTIGSQMTIAHVGDSRAYSIYSDGRIVPLTRDHSLVSRLVELGQITEEEAKTHPQKSTLYNAMGQRTKPQVEIKNEKFPEPGYIMLCSDGLWGVLTEKEMYSIIMSGSPPQKACQDLVDAANAAGGPDNIAVILVKLSE